ncbi:MAG: BT_3928 family protein, partial [Marinilabiliaceae bacterium]
FSGFVKAVDPVGGAVKFDDYFQAFQMDWLMSLSMPFSIALATLEFLIGIFLVLNLFPKRTTVVAFVFMVFFTILTLGLAIFNPVSDCGCFGDAITLTNWQTFWKNIIILIFATTLFVLRREVTSPFSYTRQTVCSLLMLLYIGGIAWYSLQHLPLLDFRPYSTGTHIPSDMSIPEDAPEPEYKTTFIMEKDGERKEFTEDDYPYEDSTWVFIDSKTEEISEGYQPPIQDFVLQHPERGDITDELMDRKTPLFLVISPKLEGITEDQAMKLAEFQQSCQEYDHELYIATSSSTNKIESFNAQTPVEFSFLSGDETNLKTIVRSNPGMLLIINGTIAGKWHYNDLPPTDAAEQPLSYALSKQQENRAVLLIGAHALLIALAALFILFRKTHKHKKQ